MKLIKWNLHEDVEAYTTTRKLGDISLNNPNYLKVLENTTRTCFITKYRFRTYGSP